MINLRFDLAASAGPAVSMVLKAIAQHDLAKAEKQNSHNLIVSVRSENRSLTVALTLNQHLIAVYYKNLMAF